MAVLPIFGKEGITGPTLSTGIGFFISLCMVDQGGGIGNPYKEAAVTTS